MLSILQDTYSLNGSLVAVDVLIDNYNKLCNFYIEIGLFLV